MNSRSPSRAVERHTWRWVFALLMLAGSAWVFAAPRVSGPDEASQLYRSWAVAHGETLGARPADGPPLYLLVEVPGDVLQAGRRGDCFSGRFAPGAPVSPDAGFRFGGVACDRPFPAEPAGNQVLTNQYRTQPTYYLGVGWLLRVFSPKVALPLMRLLSLATIAAFLASAFTSTLRLAWPRLAAVGIFGALTPLVVYLAAMVNPGGLEIATALGVWVGGLALLHGDAPADRRLVARVGVALMVLVAVRGFSPIFALLIVGALLALPGARPRVRALSTDRRLRASLVGWAAGVTLSFVGSALWLGVILRDYALPTPPGVGLAAVPGRLFPYLWQAVGMFGDSTSSLPAWSVVAWLAGVATLAALGTALVARRTALVAAAVVVVALGMDVAGDGFSFPPTGYWWQGRYVLPLLVGGIVVVTGLARPAGERAAPVRRAASRLVPVVLAMFCAVHTLGFLVMSRQVAALPGSAAHFDETLSWGEFLRHPHWSPPLLPAWAYALAYLAAMTALAWFLWTCLGSPEATAADVIEPEPEVSHGG